MKTTIKLFGMPILTIQKETTDKAIESLDKGAGKSIGFTYLRGDGFTNLSCCKKQCEHDMFSKGRMTRELMDVIQRDVNNFYSDFLEQENSHD